MFHRLNHSLSTTFSLALIVVSAFAAAPSIAKAQVFADGCYEGNGQYTGDLTGVGDGSIAYDGSYDEDTGVSSIRITVYNYLSYEVAGDNSPSFEMPLLEVDADGNFSGTGEEIRVLTIEGRYADCGVTGTWRVEDPLDEDYVPLEGSFTMEADQPTPDPAADFCAAFGGGIVPTLTLTLMMAGLGFRRRSRK